MKVGEGVNGGRLKICAKLWKRVLCVGFEMRGRMSVPGGRGGPGICRNVMVAPVMTCVASI